MEERTPISSPTSSPKLSSKESQQKQYSSTNGGATASLSPPLSLEQKTLRLTNQVSSRLRSDRKDEIFNLLSKKKYRILIQRDGGITVDQFSKMIQHDLDSNFNKDQSHAAWLVDKARSRSNPNGLVMHADTLLPESSGFFGHYNEFDNNMIWRFTSKPSEELVYITEGTQIEEIDRVIAAHSGGNDKRNPNVNTLSFARNIAALKGTAASFGGDAHVTNIIDKAEYLYGIDINTLASKGISAHAAIARDISFFESEYVLVNSPGHSPYTLEELATIRMNNPFKGQAFGDSRRIKGVNESNEGSFNFLKNAIEKEMYKEGFVADQIPDELKTPFLEGHVKRLKEYFERAGYAANVQSNFVKSVLPSDLSKTLGFMKAYQHAIKAPLKKY